MRRPVRQQRHARSKLVQSEVSCVDGLQHTAAGELFENLCSAVTAARASNLDEIRVEQAFQAGSVFAGFEAVQLGLETTQSFE